MKVEVQEFMNEQTQALTDQAEKFRRNPKRFMRKAIVDSAEGLRSLKRPLRMVAHSGVKLTEVSQSTLQSLIELQSEVVTSTLTAVAKRLERAASAEGVTDLVFDQIEMLPATRERIVDEATRAVEILKSGGRDVRKIANHAYATVTGRTDEELAAAKTEVRKTGARVRTERVVAKREVTSKAAARSASKTLSSSSTGKASKSAAGSALSQRKAPKRTTSPAAASAASKTLRDGRTSKNSKSAAGSALAQKNATRKRR